MRKIFNVGLPRTGTKSLTEALRILGFETVHSPNQFNMLEGLEAATEVRFPIKEVLNEFPDALFILSIRRSKAWLASVKRTLPLATDEWNPFWQMPEESWLELHLDQIVDFLSVPRQQRLFLNVCDGDGWEQLCEFLGFDIPEVPFPHEDFV